MGVTSYKRNRAKIVYPFLQYDKSRSEIKTIPAIPVQAFQLQIDERPLESIITAVTDDVNFYTAFTTEPNIYFVESTVDLAQQFGNMFLSATFITSSSPQFIMGKSTNLSGTLAGLALYNQQKNAASDINRMRHTYYNAKMNFIYSFNKRSTQPATKTNINYITNREIDFGTSSINNNDSANILFNFTFSQAPTFIPCINENIRCVISSSTTGTFVQAPELFSGTIYWLAVNDQTRSLDRKVEFIFEAGQENLSSADSVNVTLSRSAEFKNYADMFQPVPIILTNVDKQNVNTFLSNVTRTSFTLNTSEIITGRVYWTMMLCRRV